MHGQLSPRDLMELRKSYMFSGLEEDEYLDAARHAAIVQADAGQAQCR